jgi:hypothetical protein
MTSNFEAQDFNQRALLIDGHRALNSTQDVHSPPSEYEHCGCIGRRLCPAQAQSAALFLMTISAVTEGVVT